MNVVGFILGAASARSMPPPLPPDGGGFWYLRRADGCVLVDDSGYVSFDDERGARGYAAEHLQGARVAVRWMPKMGAH